MVSSPSWSFPCHSWLEPKTPDDLAGLESLLCTVAPVGLHVEKWGKVEMTGGPLYLLSVGNSGSVCA